MILHLDVAKLLREPVEDTFEASILRCTTVPFQETDTTGGEFPPPALKASLVDLNKIDLGMLKFKEHPHGEIAGEW
jgi:hypothetical protein